MDQREWLADRFEEHRVHRAVAYRIQRESLADRFEEHRVHRAVAYRMLSSLADAGDTIHS
ncbi:MAG TPA: hypothetical protein VLW50_26895 [Streptosporangiaceae bacterium]|nr:hypothetical protein [Streptosporangiaceae bacterium]